MSKRKILRAFFDAHATKLDYAVIKKSAKLSYSSLQNSLRKLVEEKELIKERQGTNLFYELSTFKDIEFSKITFELISELEENVRIPLNNLLKQIPKSVHSVILFGSAAKKDDLKDSNIDILIILEKFDDSQLQTLYDKEIKATIKKINVSTTYPFSIVYATKDDYANQTDIIFVSAKENGFPIMNQLKYYSDFE